MPSDLKLYAWRPRGHGDPSFFVASDSEENARAAVEKLLTHESTAACGGRRECDLPEHRHVVDGVPFGWGTDYYELTVADVLEVLVNNNS